MRRSLLILILLCLPAGAQNAPEPSPGQSVVTAQQSAQYTLPPDKLRKSEALYNLDQKLAIFTTLYSWLVLLLILSTGLGAKYRDWAESASRWRLVQAAIFVPLLFITLALFDLPFSIYRHHISLQYGLSVQGWPSWFADEGKGQALSILILAPILWIMQAIIHKSPRRWWFYFWLVTVPIVCFLTFIAPVIIEPLFNKFEP